MESPPSSSSNNKAATHGNIPQPCNRNERWLRFRATFVTPALADIPSDPDGGDDMMAVLRVGMIRCLVAWLLSGLRDVTPDKLPLLHKMASDQDEFVRDVVKDETESLF